MGKKTKNKTKKAMAKVKSSVYIAPTHPLFTKPTMVKDIPLELKRGGLVKSIDGVAKRGKTRAARSR